MSLPFSLRGLSPPPSYLLAFTWRWRMSTLLSLEGSGNQQQTKAWLFGHHLARVDATGRLHLWWSSWLTWFLCLELDIEISVFKLNHRDWDQVARHVLVYLDASPPLNLRVAHSPFLLWLWEYVVRYQAIVHRYSHMSHVWRGAVLLRMYSNETSCWVHVTFIPQLKSAINIYLCNIFCFLRSLDIRLNLHLHFSCSCSRSQS